MLLIWIHWGHGLGVFLMVHGVFFVGALCFRWCAILFVGAAFLLARDVFDGARCCVGARCFLLVRCLFLMRAMFFLLARGVFLG